MKRILFTVTNDLNHDQRMQRVCSSLASHGYRVTLIGRKRRASRPLGKQPFGQKRLFCFFEKGKLFYLEYNLRLFFYLLFRSCDIICAIDLDTIMPCLLAARLRGKKLAYDAHEYFTEVPEVIHRPVVKRAWEWVGRVAIPRADLCYTVSESLAKILSEKYKKQFHVIRNVPLLREQTVTEGVPEDKFILYQGALNAGRGLEQLIMAMQRLPLKLHLAGEGDLSNELRKITADMGLSHKITFLGYVSPEKLREMTPGAYLGYNLLEPDSLSYYYSLSNKFFDYMHALVPSMSSPLPEYSAIAGQYEVGVLTALSAENIELCISGLLQDEARYLGMKQNCLHARAHFNWQQEEQKLVKLYENI